MFFQHFSHFNEKFNKDQTVLSCIIGFNIEINITQLILISIEIKELLRNNLNSKERKI